MNPYRHWRICFDSGAANSLQLCLALCDPTDCSLLASLSMGFSRQEFWSRLPCPSPGDLPDPGTEPSSLISPALVGRFFTISITREASPTYLFMWLSLGGFPGGSNGKESTCNAGDSGLILGWGRSPGEWNGSPTPVFLPGKSHRQRNLAG